MFQARQREREEFYIHVPSPAGLIGWNIQHIPTCLSGGNMSKADIVTQQVEGCMANHSIHVHVGPMHHALHTPHGWALPWR